MTVLLTQFGATPSVTSAGSVTVNPNATIPIGTILVVGFCGASSNATMTITDSGGNVWVKSTGYSATATMTTTMWSTIVTTQLTTSSTITISASPSMARHAVACAAFSDPSFGSTVHGTVNETSSVNVIGGSDTPPANAPVFGVIGFNSTGRVFTPGAGWVAGTKYISTSGSGEKAAEIVWRDGAAGTAYAQVGTINSGGIMLCGIGHAEPAGGPPPTPGWNVHTAKVWTGSAWVAHPAKVWNGSSWVTKPIKTYAP